MTDFEKLGPYIIKGKLGQGGMGAVYRGEHVKSGEKAAIKVIASHVADQERFRRRFSLEIETLKKLDHPNIVGMTGYGEEQGHLFFAMQLIEGPSLQAHLKAEKRIHWDDVIQYGIDICAALKHAHDLGVIHRDLKPANLLIGPDNQLLVTDFGIARLWGGGNMTAEGAMLGTADYMAPEQAGGGPISQRTDLYALGNVLYACLVGRPPFAGKQLTKVITSLYNEPPPPIDMIVPEIPNEFALLIHQLLEKSADDRPPTALAVGKRLRSMQQGLHRAQATQLDDGSATIENPDGPDDPNDMSLEFGSATNLPTDERPTLDATISPGPGTGSSPGTEETIDSLDVPLPSSGTFVPQTHFRTVDQEERRRASSPITSDDEEPRSYETILSIAGLVGLLIVLIGAAIYTIQTPSASSIYETIQQANEDGELSRASRDINNFLAWYPDDARAEEVSGLADQLDTNRVLRRLRTKARIKGIGQLDPSEKAFYEALELPQGQSQRAREMLTDWMIVYRHADDDNKAAKRLVPVVVREIERLNQSTKADTSYQEIKLKKWIDDSLKRLEPSEYRKFLEALKRLHQDEPWAVEQLKRIDQLLQRTIPSDSTE